MCNYLSLWKKILMKNFFKKLKYWQIGFLVGIAILLILFFYIVIIISGSYDGKCGISLFPTLGSRYQCGFFEYLWQSLGFDLTLIALFGWWIILLIVAVPTLIGFIIDKFRKKDIYK